MSFAVVHFVVFLAEKHLLRKVMSGLLCSRVEMLGAALHA